MKDPLEFTADILDKLDGVMLNGIYIINVIIQMNIHIYATLLFKTVIITIPEPPVPPARVL